MLWRSLYVCSAVLGDTRGKNLAWEGLIAVTEDEIGAHYGLGVQLCAVGALELAEEHLLEACRMGGEIPEHWYALGRVRLSLNDSGAAIEALLKALGLRPREGAWYCSLGNALARDGKLSAALLAYQEAEALLGKSAQVSLNLAQISHLTRNYGEEMMHLREALAMNPCDSNIFSSLIYAERRVCDWHRLPYSPAELALGIESGADSHIDPFVMLPIEDCPQRQLQRSSHYFVSRFGKILRDHIQPKPKTDGLTSIGYVGSDFHEHATLYLLEGVLREHDKSAFDVHCISYDTALDEGVVDRLQSYGCKFHDFAALSDNAFIQACRDLQLDVAIDLKGYTTGSRIAPFAKGLAPVQVNFLGFPGSTGSTAHDYIVGDSVVTPIGCELAYSEKIIRLPCCYQPNDLQLREIGVTPTRQELGLPENAVVLCSFNNNYKISPAEFDIWMEVLRICPSAVLWVFVDNDAAMHNLRREAQTRGICSKRLYDARPVEHSAHLARMTCGDIFLDTFNVNAHTTASDALTVGLPVVTLRGKQFAARVAASILSHLELSELVTSTHNEYQALIIRLVEDSAARKSLKERILQKIKTSQLFNSAAYARSLEIALKKVVGLADEQIGN